MIFLEELSLSLLIYIFCLIIFKSFKIFKESNRGEKEERERNVYYSEYKCKTIRVPLRLKLEKMNIVMLVLLFTITVLI